MIGKMTSKWLSLATTSILGQPPRSLVAVQIASDLFEYQEKARSIQVYMSTFDAGI